MTHPYTVAIVQDAPITLDISGGIEQAAKLSEEAFKQGAQFIAFGETFLGGYPIWLDEAQGAALWNHPGTRAMHNLMLKHAIQENDERLILLQDLIERYNGCISIGGHERRRSSLYNNQMILRPNMPPLNHRKLVPTHGERLIWMRGDGSTLKTHNVKNERHNLTIGSLICWEHWMPMARAAMHNQGEMIHVAAWPTVREIHAIASRHYAFEGQCFVLAAGTIQNRDDMLEGLKNVGGNADAQELIETIEDGQLQFGKSFICAPDTEVLAQAGEKSEIIYATLELDMIGQGLTSLDSDGHYSRPDVFDMYIDTRAKDGVNWLEDKDTSLE